MNSLEELLKTRAPPKWFSEKAGRDKFPSKEPYRKVYIRSIKDNISWFEPVGKWMILCNCTIEDEMGLTELDKVWKVATDLYDEGVFIKVLCFTAAHTTKKESVYKETRFVHCYLENYEDVEKVTLSAAELRKRCHDFPFPLYFKTHSQEAPAQTSTMRYMCCVDGDLYNSDKKTWEILKFSTLDNKT